MMDGTCTNYLDLHRSLVVSSAQRLGSHQCQLSGSYGIKGSVFSGACEGPCPSSVFIVDFSGIAVNVSFWIFDVYRSSERG